jgi:hypothetical protein
MRTFFIALAAFSIGAIYGCASNPKRTVYVSGPINKYAFDTDDPLKNEATMDYLLNFQPIYAGLDRYIYGLIWVRLVTPAVYKREQIREGVRKGGDAKLLALEIQGKPRQTFFKNLCFQITRTSNDINDFTSGRWILRAGIDGEEASDLVEVRSDSHAQVTSYANYYVATEDSVWCLIGKDWSTAKEIRLLFSSPHGTKLAALDWDIPADASREAAGGR